MVDECHHVTKIDSTYGKILGNLSAPVRLGFTATLPTAHEAIFTLEGFLGPLIGEFDVNTAVDEKILAKPKIKLLKVPRNTDIRKLNTYPKVYEKAVVNNKQRNSMIVDIIKQARKRNESTLIVVTKLEHGRVLQDLLMENLRLSVPFVEGKMKGDERKEIKDYLISGSVSTVICTSVWREGINIPPLNNVINARLGKSEIQTLQTIGRGLRSVDGKSHVTIYDFFDNSHRYLIDHFGERITLYMEIGWI